MKTIGKLILLTFFISLLFSNCKKNEQELVIHHIDQNFYNYIIFPDSSYWVYVDSEGNIVDSVFQYKSETEFYDDPTAAAVQWEQIYIDFNSSANGKFRGICATREVRGKTIYLKEINDEWSCIFFSPGSLNEFVDYWEEFLVYVDYIDSLKVFDNWFNNVKVFHNNDSPSEYQKTLWYAKNVGLVQYKLVDGTVIKLKNYFINN